MRTILRRASALLRRERLANELAEELETHRLLLAERLRQGGMDSRAADAASRRAMGNTTLAREDSRAMWIAPWLESVGQDARYALRALVRERGFACVAIATLTAAIGLNTTIFTIFNALVLAPWPVADPASVVTIHNTSAADVRVRGGGAPGGFSLDADRLFPRALAHARRRRRHPQRRRRPDARRRRHAGGMGERQLLLAARRRDGPRPGIPAAGRRRRVAARPWPF